MISKKKLLFIHNSSVALQMVTYLEQYNLQKKNIKLIIFIENELYDFKLKKEIHFIFKNFNFKIVYLKLKKFNLFTLYNLLEWRKIFFINKLNYEYLKKTLHKNKIDLNNFDEILFSNERSSNYINHMFAGRKIFFFHGIGDIKIFIKQNYVKDVKNLLLNFLNYVFNRIDLINKKNLTAVLFLKFIKLKFIGRNMIKINTKMYRLNLKKFSNYMLKKIKFQLRKNFTLYILKFPRFKVKESNYCRNKYLTNYLNFQFRKIYCFINQVSILRKSIILIKTKNNVSEKESMFIKLIAKSVFKNNKIQFLTNKKKSIINAEVFACHDKCKAIISNMSTVDFLVKIINSKIKIFQYDKIVTKFNMNNKFYTKKNIDIKPSFLKKYYKTNQHITI